VPFGQSGSFIILGPGQSVSLHMRQLVKLATAMMTKSARRRASELPPLRCIGRVAGESPKMGAHLRPDRAW